MHDRQRFALHIPGNMPNMGNYCNSSENALKKSVSRALDIKRSCWVSMTSLRKILLMVRGLTWILEASQWFVLPWRRSSSRINCPIGTCMLPFDFRKRKRLCNTSCYRFLALSRWPQTKRRRANLVSQSAVVGLPLKGKTKMLAWTRTFAFCFPLSPWWKFLRFRLGRNK